MARNTRQAQTIDQIVNAVRSMGFSVRFSGFGGEGVIYDVISAEGAFARRYEAGLRQIVNGTDPYFS